MKIQQKKTCRRIRMAFIASWSPVLEDAKLVFWTKIQKLGVTFATPPRCSDLQWTKNTTITVLE